MDRIRGLFKDLTGGDGAVGREDVTNTVGDQDVDDLKARADDLGIGNIDLDVLTSLEFPLTKEEIMSQLRGAGTNDMLVSMVGKVPDQVYENLNQLKEKLPI